MTTPTPPHSRVVLQGLEFHARHGVFDTEAVLGARFVVDAELHYPFAGLKDDLDEAVNYAAMYAAIQEEVTVPRHQLIEVLAGHVARRILRDLDRKSTRLNSSHTDISRMPSSA